MRKHSPRMSSLIKNESWGKMEVPNTDIAPPNGSSDGVETTIPSGRGDDELEDNSASQQYDDFVGVLGGDDEFKPLPTTKGRVSRVARPSIVSAFGQRSSALMVRPSMATRSSKFELNRNELHALMVAEASADAIPGEHQKQSYRHTLLKFNEKSLFENYVPKPANKIFRWNLLWLVLLLVAPYPLWLTFVACRLSYEITIIVNVVLTLNFIYTTVLCWVYMWRLIRCFNTPYWEELQPDLREKVQHLVIMPTYKEPIGVLMETIDSVANQSVAQSIVMVVGMEEKTPFQQEKIDEITEKYGDSFKGLCFTVHPFSLPGEIAGACSNRNWAARQGVKFMIKNELLAVDPVTKEVDLDFTCVTVCDSDTTFFRRYFENLTWSFLNEPPESRYQVCWQSPLFYNIALDERYFFTRVMGILRSYFMVGFLIGADINTMSIYSMSLSLLVDSKFFHPGYQMDDIIYTLSAMKATGKRIKIRTIDFPTLSGPTSGDTIWKEWEEWVVQATRWTIGAAEVFHYFFIKLLKRDYVLPGFQYFWWFVYYYGFVLCVAGLISLSGLVVQFISLGLPEYSISECKPMQSWFDLDDDWRGYDWIIPFFIFFNYIVVFGTAFCMDALVSQILALNEHIHPIRNLCHFISCQFVLWAYALVEYKGIIQIAIHGKAVCGHIASDKGALVKEGETKK
jgi:hypothetical protein